MKDRTAGITLTLVEGPPPLNSGRHLGTGEIRASYMRTAEMMKAHKNKWFSLGIFPDGKLDYLRKVLINEGCEVTTRRVGPVGSKDFHVYATYTGRITVRTRRARRASR